MYLFLIVKKISLLTLDCLYKFYLVPSDVLLYLLE